MRAGLIKDNRQNRSTNGSMCEIWRVDSNTIKELEYILCKGTLYAQIKFAANGYNKW